MAIFVSIKDQSSFEKEVLTVDVEAAIKWVAWKEEEYFKSIMQGK